jgi:hypothetical protein
LKSAKLMNRREMEIEVDGQLPSFVREGLCIENLTWTPEVIIRNSHFERTNTRGLLLTTRRKVIIENNVFYHTGMFPILIADDASSWFESGAVHDVTIRNNIFDECGYNSGSGAINIAPENHELLPGNLVHSNIRVINNIFKTNYQTVISARSTDQLVFSGNKIVYGDAVKQAKDIIALNLLACTNVSIDNNNFSLAEKPAVNIQKMTTTDLKTDLKVTSE